MGKIMRVKVKNTDDYVGLSNVVGQVVKATDCGDGDVRITGNELLANGANPAFFDADDFGYFFHSYSFDVIE